MMRTILSSIGLIVMMALACAQPFTYQGLLKQSGTPANGTYQMTFRLYNVDTGGTALGNVGPLSVPVANGLFTVELNFPASVWDGGLRYLEIQVGSTTLTPRVKINPTPYASTIRMFESGTANPDRMVIAHSPAFSNWGLQYQDASDKFNFLVGGTPVMTVDLANQRVGIGTNSPGYRLHVQTNAGERAIFGVHTATSGITYGGWFQSDSPSGTGVYGEHAATSGTTPGVHGRTASTSANAVGVLGEVVPTSPGVNSAAVRGINNGTGGSGIGVWGSHAGSGWGVYGTSVSGTGVLGYATATSGTTYGGWFQSDSTSGRGVFGYATATSGANYGVWGESASTSGRGVFGYATATSGFTYGVFGESRSTSGRGVYGYATATSGGNYGVWGESASTSGTGVYGYATATSSVNYGVYGRSDSTSGTGVHGWATATSGVNYGVYGRSDSTFGRGVYGFASATSSINYGVYGLNDSTSGRGVFGYATATSGVNYGVYGRSDSTSGTGVYGYATATSGTAWGVWGKTDSTASNAYGVIGDEPTGGAGHAVYAIGTFAATGTKSFQTDHPLHPETHFLNHFCTEGPDPMNAYSGVVVLDARGEAWVQLPDYFDRINRDPRYILTPIGAPMPNLHVAVKIQNNRFKIAGGVPGGEVSWRVEAIRNDRWVQEYGYQTEQEKPKEYQGNYLNPELYGQPKERGIFYRPEPEQPREGEKPQ